MPPSPVSLENERALLRPDFPLDSTWLRYCPQDRLREEPVLQRVAAYLALPETQATLDDLERRQEYPESVVERLRELGLPRLFSEVGADPLATPYHLCLLNLVAASHDTSLAITLGVNSLSLISAYVGASPEQLAQILERVGAGEFSAMLLTELACGSDLLRSQARAEGGRIGADGAFEPVAEGEAPTHYRLSGEKQLINGGNRHSQFFVLLRTRDACASEEGRGSPLAGRGAHSMFWVERQEGTEGLARWATLPARGADISGVRFDDVVVPAAQRLGVEGEGYSLAQKVLSVSRGGISALAMGTLERARALALGYAAQRHLYGEPIAARGAIALHLLRMEALTRAGSAASLRANAWVNACGLKAVVHTAVAKLIACRAAEEGVGEGRQVLGGRALLADLPYARLIRDVLLYGVFDGTSHVMLEELKVHLARAVRAHRRGRDAERDTLDESRRVYALPLRSLVDSTRGAPLVKRPLPTAWHARALCAVEGATDLSPLVDLVEALFAIVAATMDGGGWTSDQALAHALASVYAEVEALLALVETFDPDRRATLMSPVPGETEFDRRATRYALGWLGGRACSQLSRRMAQAGLSPEILGAELVERGGLAGIEARFLRGHDELRHALAAELLTPA